MFVGFTGGLKSAVTDLNGCVRKRESTFFLTPSSKKRNDYSWKVTSCNSLCVYNVVFFFLNSISYHFKMDVAEQYWVDIVLRGIGIK